MKAKGIIATVLLAGAILACDITAAPTTQVAQMPTIVAATLQAIQSLTPSAPPSPAAPTQPAGTSISFGNVSFAIPMGLATGATSETVPAVDAQSGGPWESAPAFIRFTLQSYPLQNEFFQPQIMVYPAQAYASANNGASLSLQRLQSILGNPSGPLNNDLLPRLPYANAEQVIGAQPKVLAFGGGQGVRALAEYSQAFVSIDNHDLVYHFEGLTTDGKYYVIAVLPVNASFLAASGDPAAPVPPGGIPFPADIGDGTPVKNYFQAMTDKLNGTAADAFRPTLTLLDALIQSLQVSP